MAYVHLHVHSEYSPLDGLSKVNDLVAAAVADNNPALAITDHGTLGGIWKLGLAAAKAGIKPVPGCLLAGQEIVTAQGVKGVEDVAVGDLVLTHRGRFRRVLSTMSRRHEGRAYRVHLGGRYSRPLVLTEEHPILVRTRDGRVDWMKPGDIPAGRYSRHGGVNDWNAWVCLPKLAAEVSAVDMADFLPAASGWRFVDGYVTRVYRSKYRGDETWKAVPARLQLDEQLAYFMGLYAAEGSLHRRVSTDGEEFTGEISLAFHVAETHLIARVVAFAEQYGATATVRRRHRSRPLSDNGVEVTFSSLPIALLLAHTVGHDSWRKQVPAQVMQAAPAARRAFVQGLVDGDGKTPELPSNKNRSAMVKVVSRDLAWGLRTLLADMGHFVSVGVNQEPSTVTRPRRPAYVVCYSPHRAWSRTLEDDDYVYRPILRVEPLQLDADVFNFEVEEDNSYVSDFVLHNCEVYLAVGSRHEQNTMPAMDDDTDEGEGVSTKKYEHLTLLAISRTGWGNLVTMTNESQDTFWHKPRIDYDLLTRYGEGLIVLTGCLGGPVAGQLARGNRDAAIVNLHKLIAAVGKDNVYVEVMDHGIPAQLRIMDDLRSVAAELDLPVVATNDSHYLHAEDKDAHEAWLAVGTRKVLTDEKRFKFHGTGHHLRTETEMRALQGGADWWQNACDTTVTIAARVADNVLPAPRLRLPKYPLPDGFTDSGTYLKHLVRQGARDRYGQDPARPGHLPPVVNERLKFEFGVVHPAGLDDYFLITWDVIAWARSDRGLPTEAFPMGEPGRKKPIRVGPGRGSASGSAISYCLHIVGVDPLKHGLLFERFLNPERTGMPDIDVDFEQGRRPEVLRYIERRFGRDRVARIGTFGVAATRMALIDAARVTGVTWLGAKLSPLVPIGASGKPVSLATLADVNDKSGEAFRKAVTGAGAPAQTVLALARSFEGVTKREGIHACGTLIADEPMVSLVPLRHDRAKGATDEDLLVTVWDGKDVDGYGLLKMDVLGLRNLDVISAAVDFIEETTGHLVDPDALIPGDPTDQVRDTKTWELISSGRTGGVFQLESPGITSLAEKVAPSSLADLTALVALYRPGPMAAKMHEHYAARKNGHEAIDYEDTTNDPDEQDVIASVLGATYGTIIFQEQLMSLGGAVGGLDPVMRNTLQKAFSKKDKEKMALVKGAFYAGGLAGAGPAGVKFSQATLDNLWVTFDGAAAYLFNQCITGDTVLENGKGIKWTVRDLYERLHGTDSSDGRCSRCHERPVAASGRCRRCDSWLTMFADPDRGFSLMAHHSADGRLRPARVKDVHHKGDATVFAVTLSDGTVLHATANHRFMAADTTYVRVSQMVPGLTELLVDGGSVALKEWTEDTRAAAKCTTCGRTEGRLERAHLDGNRRPVRWDKGHVAATATVVSIELDGLEAVWDVEMADGTDHNFTANGVVSHNSHACAYGFISYQTAYLKANWPVQYGAALLSVTDNDDRRVSVIRSLHTEGVTILAPDVNASAVATRPDGDSVRLGLSEVKGVGKNATHLVAERDRNGPFTGVGDVLTRCRIPALDKSGNATTGALPVTTVEALIEAGAFDEFGSRMGQSMIVRAARAAPSVAPVDAEWGVLERAARQRNRLGLITGTHPLKVLKDQVGVFRDTAVEAGEPLMSVQDAAQSADGNRVTILGVLAGWTEKAYKRGRMVSLTVEGSLGAVDGVMWDEDRARLVSIPNVGDLVLVVAEVRVRLVETEHLDDDGQTVTESFERRDLTVKKVDVAPVVDPCTVVVPQLPALVVPETTVVVPARPAPESPELVTAGGRVEPDWVVLDGSAPDREPDLGASGDWDDMVPVFEPPSQDDHLAPDPDNYEDEPVPTLQAPTLQVRLKLGQLATRHPAARAAALTFGSPPHFNEPDGGEWVLPAQDGTKVWVTVGEHTHGVTNTEPEGPGWTAVPIPSAAAA